jgi:hypothetical protein
MKNYLKKRKFQIYSVCHRNSKKSKLKNDVKISFKIIFGGRAWGRCKYYNMESVKRYDKQSTDIYYVAERYGVWDVEG